MTKLDRLLDLVAARERELTLDVSELTEGQKDHVIAAAMARGFSAAGDGGFILIRDLRSAKLPEKCP